MLKFENILDDVNHSLIGSTYYPITEKVCDVKKV